MKNYYLTPYKSIKNFKNLNSRQKKVWFREGFRIFPEIDLKKLCKNFPGNPLRSRKPNDFWKIFPESTNWG